MKKIIIHNDTFTALPGKMTTHSWEIPPSLSYDEWRSAGLRLGQIKDWTNFAIGDWIQHGEAKWGERYTQAVSELDIGEERLRQMKWVAARIPAPIRNNNLTWSHHYTIASMMSESLMVVWLEKAKQENWGVRELQDELVKAGLREQRVRKELAPAGLLEAQQQRHAQPLESGELVNVDQPSPPNGLPTCPVCEEEPATIPVCSKCVESIHLAFEQIRSKHIHKRKGRKHGTRENGNAAGSDERQN